MIDSLLSILVVAAVLLLFVFAILLFRATMFGIVPEPVEEVETPSIDSEVVAFHLAEAVRRPTISDFDPSRVDQAPFCDLHRLLERLYPRVHGALNRELVAEYALLFTWKGRDPELQPVLLMGHLDVVPVDPAARDEWTHPPFDGEVADGYVWGRGTLDMKSIVICELEAVENLIKSGYQPERTLYLAFGHDEEVGGLQGAKAIAALLESRGVTLAAVLDEGGSLVTGVIPGIDLPVALVGVAEKGYATFELRVEGRPGHSSAPPKHTAIGVLSRAVARLEVSPRKPRLGMAMELFRAVGAFLPFTMRLALANTWLFSGSIHRRLEKNPQTNALQRTTAAVTVIRGGIRDNVLPAIARAYVNTRLLPGDKVTEVTDWLRKIIRDDAVQVEPVEDRAYEAPPVSSSQSQVYVNMARTIRQIYPAALVAPYLMLGTTDSRHYTGLCTNIYRFSPYLLDADLLRTVHGNDERIAIATLGRMVAFYLLLIKSWTTVVGSPEG